ncbi:MAG: hypothetical protein WC736_15390 [Gallionella sp.]|jgi:hypothetical protein
MSEEKLIQLGIPFVVGIPEESKPIRPELTDMPGVTVRLRYRHDEFATLVVLKKEQIDGLQVTAVSRYLLADRGDHWVMCKMMGVNGTVTKVDTSNLERDQR